MIKFILLLFVLTTSLFPQGKYFIYFKDKGTPEGTLRKNSAAYNEALSLLSERAIERRKKVMGDNFITYEDLPVFKEYVTRLKSMGIKIQHELKWFNSVSAYLDDVQLGQVKQLPFVLKTEPVKTLVQKPDIDNRLNDIYQPQKVQVDSVYGVSYVQLATSDIPVVHQAGITGTGVLIGMLDSGFDWEMHNALKNIHVVDEYDFIFNDTVTADEFGDQLGQHNHGTSTLSLVGGYKPGSFLGAAYGADFLLAKTENIASETHAEEDNYAAALIWMEERGVDITSSSLGYTVFDNGEGSYTYRDMDGQTTIVTKAAEAAFSRGVLTISAAGNEGNKAWHYISAPSDGFNTIAVGSVNSSNELAAYSGRGPSSDGRIKPDILAQGSGDFQATAGTANAYGVGQGTSYATPIASGIAALLYSAYPHLTNVQARRILQMSGDNADNPNNERGYGLLSAVRAVSYPNIDNSDNNFRLNKAFIGVQNIVPSTVTLNYSVNNNNFENAVMHFDGSLKYFYDFASIPSGSDVQFYFTYSTTGDSSFRIPGSGMYDFKAGEDIVLSVNAGNTPDTYTLSQNYPNPFNNRTNINFIAGDNEKAELIVIDVTGQKVITLFNGYTKNGVNSVAWDGRNEAGITAASGVYYYILKLSGKEYGRKMVLLK